MQEKNNFSFPSFPPHFPPTHTQTITWSSGLLQPELNYPDSVNNLIKLPIFTRNIYLAIQISIISSGSDYSLTFNKVRIILLH